MFRHPAWAVAIYSSGQPAAGTVGTKSTEFFANSSVSPCMRDASSAVDRLFPPLVLIDRQVIFGPGMGDRAGRARRRLALPRRLAPLAGRVYRGRVGDGPA